MADSTLFIPDISGFTQFVNSTEIEHSTHIIEELINLIVDEGSKDFEMAEIEGDAVFFYKKDSHMTPALVLDSAKRIFTAFHKHLLLYENKRICNCGACTQAVDLKLKFVVHSGQIELAQFREGRAKPFGSPVIAIHRMLKNDVQSDEYIILSDDFIAGAEMESLDKSAIEDSDLGEVRFGYKHIAEWASGIELEVEEVERQKKFHISVERNLSLPHNADELYRFISDFRYRKLWNSGVDEIIFNEAEINQVGSQHYCVIKGKDLYFDTIKPEALPEQRAYGEILRNPAPLKYVESSFIITPKGEEESHLQLLFKAALKYAIQRPLLPFIRKKINQQLDNVVIDLQSAADEHLRQETTQTV